MTPQVRKVWCGLQGRSADGHQAGGISATGEIDFEYRLVNLDLVEKNTQEWQSQVRQKEMP